MLHRLQSITVEMIISILRPILSVAIGKIRPIAKMRQKTPIRTIRERSTEQSSKNLSLNKLKSIGL